MEGIQIVILNKLLLGAAVILSVVAVHNMFLAGKTDVVRKRELVLPDNGYRILLGIVLVTALVIRVLQFGAVPGGMNQDGAMAAVDAKALAEYGTDHYGMRLPVHLTAWKYGQMSSLLSYLMVPFIKVFGFSVTVVRLPQLMVSLCGLVVLFLLVRDIFGRNCALVIAFFAALNPWHILQSRWTIDCNLFPHFLIFGMYFLNRAAMGKRKAGNLVLSMLFFGLSMYCYGISLYTVPLFLLAACVLLLVTKRIRLREAFSALAVWLLISWPFLLTMMVNFFQWETIETPFFTIPYFTESIRSNDILFFSDHIIRQFFENAVSLVRVVVMQEKDLPWNDMEKFGSMYLFSMPFAGVGIVGLCRRLKDNPGVSLILLFLLMGLWSGVATNQVNINRINCVFYPVIILIGLGIFEVMEWCAVPGLRYYIVSAYLLGFCFFADSYFTSYAYEVGLSFQADYGNAVSSLRDAEADKIYIASYGGEQTAVREILTLFWLGTDAGYYQGEETQPGELPYAEKFVYTEISSLAIDQEEAAVYLVTADDLQYFDSSIFSMEQYGQYYVVTRQP